LKSLSYSANLSLKRLAVKGVINQAYMHLEEMKVNSLFFIKNHPNYIKQLRGANKMITMLGTGAIFFSLAWAEKKGYVDPMKVKTIITVGMGFGIGAVLLYFVYFLSHGFLI
jgi:hypothetical protein